jgi:hypothetical protein
MPEKEKWYNPGSEERWTFANSTLDNVMYCLGRSSTGQFRQVLEVEFPATPNHLLTCFQVVLVRQNNIPHVVEGQRLTHIVALIPVMDSVNHEVSRTFAALLNVKKALCSFSKNGRTRNQAIRKLVASKERDAIDSFQLTFFPSIGKLLEFSVLRSDARTPCLWRASRRTYAIECLFHPAHSVSPSCSLAPILPSLIWNTDEWS